MTERTERQGNPEEARRELIERVLRNSGIAVTSSTSGRPYHREQEPGAATRFSDALTPAGRDELARGAEHLIRYIPTEGEMRAHGVTEVLKTLATQSEHGLDENPAKVRGGAETLIDLQPMMQDEAMYGGDDDVATLAVHYFTLPSPEFDRARSGEPQVVVSFVSPESTANALTSQADPELMQELIERAATDSRHGAITPEEWEGMRPNFDATGERRLYVDQNARTVRIWRFDPAKIVSTEEDEPQLGKGTVSIDDQEAQNGTEPTQRHRWFRRSK